MYYDLHIHSALSPCSDDDMTINNIVNMAQIKHLDVISISDHNAIDNWLALEKVAKDKIKVLYGVEVQTKEEVHVLAYFTSSKEYETLYRWLDQHLLKIKNQATFFGNQLVFNEKDEIIANKENLLISSLDLSINQVCHYLKSLGGFVCLAHALGRRNSIITQLGFISEELVYDAIEVVNKNDKQLIIDQNPHCANKIWLKNSDAHTLVDISEATEVLPKELELLVNSL